MPDDSRRLRERWLAIVKREGKSRFGSGESYGESLEALLQKVVFAVAEDCHRHGRYKDYAAGAETDQAFASFKKYRGRLFAEGSEV